MQPSNKKEVSCKALASVFLAAKIKNIDTNALLEGVPYKLEYLLNKRERIEWWVWCKFISNSRVFFSPSEFEDMGAGFVKSGIYVEGILIAFFLFSTNKIARILKKIIFRLGDSLFSCIKENIEYVDKNKIRVTLYLEEGYEFCPEFFLISKGTWEQLALQIGHKGTNVNLTLVPPNAVFDVSWNREGFLFKIRRAIKWLFNFKKAFLELTESHGELRNQYNKLEESKKLLQKQTTQLKTAHEISTSIRQSLNIKDTLKAIADILVKEAGFTFASIRLFKDMEDNNIDIKTETGEEIKSISRIQQEIIINEKKIGALIVSPNLETDYRVIDELLIYLSPVINIAIHDALVLRAIIDYKDNLEQKVADRTFELQKTSDKLLDTNALLKEAQQVQNRFFTNISHEFRTPLTLILGPAKQLLERFKDDKAKEQLDLIHRSASKLNKLVDELLDISKIEAGEMKLKVCPVDLVSFVKEITLSFHALAERKKITFKFNSDDDEIIAYIDKDKIDKILTNVLSNAFKFTPEGGKVEVSIRPKPPFNSPFSKGGKEEGSVEISIRDTGIGIPQDQLDKIFDRFYQVDGSHTREHEGTGIGLSLTKELVELHKGKIEVESDEGKGSIFKLTFPLGKDHLRPEEICEEEKEQDKDEDKEKTRIPLSDEDNEQFRLDIEESTEGRKVSKVAFEDYEIQSLPTLLVVEDNPDVRKYISMILENRYKIIEAKDGEEGLNKAFESASGGPDLIITDIMMPKMDGFQFCSALKTDSRTSHIPIIMLTAKATMQDKISGLEIGADDYIMKPFEAEELKARIKNLLEQRKRLHEHFRQHGLFELDEKNINSIDKKFLEKSFAIINEHISDTSFGVVVLAENMNVTRSVLLKKIEALIGESPLELIKRTRLSTAAKLIEKNFGNVSEVALEVGFNNPSHFAECFKKQFGVSPSQYHSKS